MLTLLLPWQDGQDGQQGTGLVVRRDSPAPSRLPIGLQAAGGAAIRKERPQRPAKMRRTSDRQTGWWLAGLVLVALRRNLAAHTTDPHSLTARQLTPLSAAASPSVRPAARLSLFIHSSKDMGQRTQPVIS